MSIHHTLTFSIWYMHAHKAPLQKVVVQFSVKDKTGALLKVLKLLQEV